MTLEILTAALVAILGVASMLMLVLAMGALVGVVRFRRCERCEHLTVTSADGPVMTCTYCEHERLMHPIAAWQRSHLGHRPSP